MNGMRSRAIIVVVLLVVLGGVFLTEAESHVCYPETRLGVRSQNFTPEIEKVGPQNPDYTSLEQFLTDGFTSSTLVIQKEFDATHLAYFGARYYDPTTGRFTAVDPFMGHLTDPRSQFMYGYGFNNPLMYVDPFGFASYRQWLGLDQPWYEAENLTSRNVKEAAYNVFNFISMGTLARQDTLVEQYETNQISDVGYWGKTAVNAAESGVVLAASTMTGGVAGGAAVRVIGATGRSAMALAATVAGGTGSVTAVATSDLINVNVLGVQDTWSSGETYLKAAALGVTGGGLGVGAARGSQYLQARTGSSFYAMPSTGTSVVSSIARAETKLFEKSFSVGTSLGSRLRDPLNFSNTFDSALRSASADFSADMKTFGQFEVPYQQNNTPVAYGTPHRQLSQKSYTRLKAKIANRTITSEEYKRLRWYERLEARRQKGITDFWATERRKLRAGQPGTRNWSQEAREAIMRGDRPAGIYSHHKYSVSMYPQLANDPTNIYPSTFYEHFYRWHGGNWGPTHGVPRNPSYPEWF